MPRKDTTASALSSAQAQQELASDGIEGYELPKSVVTRIARSAFPDNIKLQKEAVMALLKGSTVFVNYLAATAHDVAASKQHKSVSASDVLKALELTQFGDMVDKLQDELQAYRDLQKVDKTKKTGSRGKAKEVDSASAAGSTSKAKGKQKAIPSGATIVIPGSRPASAQLPPPSSEVEPEGDEEDADETEDDARVIHAPSEGGDDDVVEPEEEEVEEEEDDDIEDIESEGDEEETDIMAVEEDELKQDANELDSHSTRDQDVDMDT